MQLLDLAGTGHALGAYLVDVQLVELEAHDRRRPARAGAPGGQPQKFASAAAARLVNVQLVEFKAPIDTGRPEATSPGAAARFHRRWLRAWCAPGRRPAARHKVRITEKQLLSSEKTTSSPHRQHRVGIRGLLAETP